MLKVAKPDFLNTYGSLLRGEDVTPRDKTMYRYYCEAVMVFRHFQRPGAVEGMTVSSFQLFEACRLDVL